VTTSQSILGDFPASFNDYSNDDGDGYNFYFDSFLITDYFHTKTEIQQRHITVLPVIFWYIFSH